MVGHSLGSFVVTDRIGSGGMGVVHAGEHRATGTPVAVKLLRRASDPSGVTHARFADEVRAVAALDHPHVIRVHDQGVLERPTLGLPAGTPWLAMERAEESLADRVAARGRPPLGAVVELLVAVGEALTHAHARGVLHRDVKPGNLLFVVDRAGRQRLVLADFGIAAVGVGADAVAGTPSWMAPEQFRPDGALGPWTDLYALGVLGWWLLTGTTPHGDGDWDELAVAHRLEPLPPLRADVPPALASVIERLLDKRPDRRPSAWSALCELEDLRSDPGPAWTACLPAEPFAPARLADAGLGLLALRAPPFTGRDAEVQVAYGALADAAMGRGGAQTVLVRGPSGVGKTRFARHVAELVVGEGSAGSWMLTRASDPDLGECLRRLLRMPTTASPHAFAANHPFTARLGRRDQADVAAWLTGSPPGRITDRVQLVARVIGALEAWGNVVLIVDDAQDHPEGLALLEHLASGPAIQLLVLATVRTDGLAGPIAERLHALATRDAVRDLPLGPLSIAGCRALLAGALPLDDGLVATLAERADGSTMLAVQLLATLAESGTLRRGAQGWIADELPSTAQLTAVWGASLDQVATGDDRRALQLAAILGPRVDPRTWAQACDRARLRPATDLLDRLLRRGLADRSGGAWSYAHAALREALRHEAGGAARGWHRIAADLLPEDAPRRHERLGRHLLGAGDRAGAEPELLEAARVRRRAGDYRGALALLDERDRAREDGADPAGWMVRAEALLRLGAIDDAEALIDRAAAAASQPDQVAEAAIRKGMILDRRGRSAEATAHLQHGRELAEQLGASQLLGWAREQLAQVAMRRGRYAEAESLAMEAAADYEAQEQLHGLSNCMLIAGVIAIKGGDAAAARPRFERLLELAVMLNLRTNEGHARMNLGEIARMEGDLAAAATHYAEAEGILEPTGGIHALFPKLNLAIVRIEQGQTEPALPVLLSIAEELARRGRGLLEVMVRLALLRCYGARLDRHNWDRNLDRIEELLAGTDELDREVAELAEAAGRDAVSRGWPRRARAAFGIAADHWTALGRPEAAGRARALSRDVPV